MFKIIIKYLGKVIAAAYFGLLIMLLVTIPLRFATYNPTIVNTISSILCVIGSLGCLFILCIKDGYDDNGSGKQTSFVKTIICMSVAVATYDVLTIILQYHTGAASNVAYIAQALGKIDSITSIKEMASEHSGLMLVSLIIQTIPFIPAMIGGYKFGEKKRLKSRKELYDNKI